MWLKLNFQSRNVNVKLASFLSGMLGPVVQGLQEDLVKEFHGFRPVACPLRSLLAQTCVTVEVIDSLTDLNGSLMYRLVHNSLSGNVLENMKIDNRKTMLNFTGIYHCG